jgi:hypothetical protein
MGDICPKRLSVKKEYISKREMESEDGLGYYKYNLFKIPHKDIFIDS